jgi:hypothetical protein
MNYRRYDLDVPKELDDRIRKAMDTEIEKGRLRADVSPRDYLLALLMQGLAVQEVRQADAARGSRLVMTPDELAETQKRLRGLKRV